MYTYMNVGLVVLILKLAKLNLEKSAYMERIYSQFAPEYFTYTYPLFAT